MLMLVCVNDTPTTVVYTLSLHDALPIYPQRVLGDLVREAAEALGAATGAVYRWDEEHALLRPLGEDRKSTRLNSSHQIISYAVFCLKKKTQVACLHLLQHRRDPTPRDVL